MGQWLIFGNFGSFLRQGMSLDTKTWTCYEKGLFVVILWQYIICKTFFFAAYGTHISSASYQKKKLIAKTSKQVHLANNKLTIMYPIHPLTHGLFRVAKILTIVLQ